MRTHWCGELRAEHRGEKVRLAGWVHRRRDHGGVIFLDLRDREGLVQVVARPEQTQAYGVAERARSEFLLAVEGSVDRRPSENVNPNVPTGEVEVVATAIEVVAESDTPPFAIEDRVEVAEETRIRYRYLDLRRPEMLRVLRLRHKVVATIRSFFDEQGFIEVETPMLTRATPEGARDFLVPSRLQPGTFFALPQSPQLFKQLLMVAGIERYYQIARCFRDEDPRADRQPDFTQLDVEMSFVEEPEIFDLVERMFVRIFREVLEVELPAPFPRIAYDDAGARYGTDKPDLRFGLEIADATAVFSGTRVELFRPVLASGGVVKAVAVPGQADLPRRTLDGLEAVARGVGAVGMTHVAFHGDEISSPLRKFLSAAEAEGLKKATGADDGDLVLIVADRKSVAETALGAVRLALADLLDLRPDLPPGEPEAWKFVWVVDPPLFEWNEQERRWDPTHHPFTAPRPEHEALLEGDPGAVRARAYDIVLNGWELGTGSIRIHRPQLQRRIFERIGLDEESVRRRFGWFLKAFDYGAPPHGGIAPGIDRIVARIAGLDHIRGAIAFPKTGTYTDPLTGAPDSVDDSQLAELRLRVVPPK